MVPLLDGGAEIDWARARREYAFEQLQTCGELEATLHRHARYYLLLAQRAHESDEPRRSSLQALLPELEEVRAALRRCLELEEHDQERHHEHDHGQVAVQVPHCMHSLRGALLIRLSSFLNCMSGFTSIISFQLRINNE